MRLTVFSYRRAPNADAGGGSGAGSDQHGWLRASHPWTTTEEKVDPAGRCTAARLGSLDALHQVWRTKAAGLDYIGFEDASEPMLLDPMVPLRLQAMCPAAFELRRQVIDQPGQPVRAVSPFLFDQLPRLRQAFTVADQVRLERWVGRHDLIVPPARAIEHDQRRMSYFADRWPRIEAIARTCGAFRAVPADDGLAPKIWPWSLAFIMRRDLFMSFCDSLFGAVVALDRQMPEALTGAVPLLGERLLGGFLQAMYLEDALLRVGTISRIRAVSAEVPLAPPPDFDAASYLDLHPDVRAAGVDPASHWLDHGRREGRDWGI